MTTVLKGLKSTKVSKRVEFYSPDSQIIDLDGKVVAVGIRKGNLYYITCQQKSVDQVHMSEACLNSRSK